jgi:hypothetical protein
VTLLCLLLGPPLRANAEENAVSLAPGAAGLAADPALPPAGLDVNRQPAAPSAAPKSTILERWWFWTAVGAVAAATVGVIIVSSRGSAVPSTELGNQVFAR